MDIVFTCNGITCRAYVLIWQWCVIACVWKTLACVCVFTCVCGRWACYFRGPWNVFWYAVKYSFLCIFNKSLKKQMIGWCIWYLMCVDALLRRVGIQPIGNLKQNMLYGRFPFHISEDGHSKMLSSTSHTSVIIPLSV